MLILALDMYICIYTSYQCTIQYIYNFFILTNVGLTGQVLLKFKVFVCYRMGLRGCYPILLLSIGGYMERESLPWTASNIHYTSQITPIRLGKYNQ